MIGERFVVEQPIAIDVEHFNADPVADRFVVTLSSCLLEPRVGVKG